jgi:hypothetical protein
MTLKPILVYRRCPLVCNQCNTGYEVTIDDGGRTFISAEELDIELPYCPACGYETEDWHDDDDDMDL